MKRFMATRSFECPNCGNADSVLLVAEDPEALPKNFVSPVMCQRCAIRLIQWNKGDEHDNGSR